MFAKSTITLFVLAVGLSSLLSGNGIGSASAYPRPDNTSMNLDLDDDDPIHVKSFEDMMDLRQRNKFGAVTVLINNAIPGGNTTGENHMVSEVNQKHVMMEGKLPEGGHIYGAVTYSSGNAIQSDGGKNFLGSRLTQEDITYKFKD